MGHIGGATLEKLIAVHPELSITALVRSDNDSAILKHQYEHAKIKTQIGNLKDTDAMESLARKATIVLSAYSTRFHS
jgi:saccharopine dehydrogenase-like NADP-dependent oxidoreductase